MSKSKKSKSGSLRDQLLAAGVVTKKQVKKAEKGSLRQELRIKKGIEVDQNKAEVEKARQAKLELDREKNAALNQKAQQKALRSQVKQLIISNSRREDGEVPYNFTDQKKVKKIYISEANKTQLNRGFLAIVSTEDGYDLVPEPVARKILERYAEAVIYLFERENEIADEDDPYKDYPIPDDLDW